MARLTDTISGAIATFRTPGKQDIRSLKVHFAPVQEGTGNPSPDNVRSISGWTGVEVYQRGKNLIDKNALTGTSSVWWNGNVIGGYSNPPHCVTPKIPVKPGTQYYLKRDSGNQNYISTFDKNGNFLRQTICGSNGAMITMPDDVCFVGITIAVAAADSAQLELGSAATAYEPYQGTTLPIDWTDSAGTVYGGYVDLVTGEVWETHHKQVIDESSTIGIFPWGGVKTDSTTGTEYATVLFMRSANDPRARNIASNLCDKLPYSTNQNKINVAYMYDGDTYGPALSLPTSLIGTTQETLKQYLTGNPFTFVYMLREPVLLTTLTPTALKTLIGTNNIWSNANGNVDVEYDFAESREMLEARKRVATFKWKRSRLPAGYREVEYLESRSNPEGMQWPYINTGIGASVNKNTKAEITFHIDCDEAFVFGARYSTSQLMFNINRPDSNSAVRVDIGSSYSGSNTKLHYFDYSDTGTYTVHMEYYSASVKRHSDGIVINRSYSRATTTGVTAPNLYLFAVATGSSSMSCAIKNGIMRIMSAKIWEGDPSVLVRDFVPCIRKSDNKAGMYDLVNNVFYPPKYGKFFTNLD